MEATLKGHETDGRLPAWSLGLRVVGCGLFSWMCMEGLPIMGDGCADALHWRNLRNGLLRVSIGKWRKDFFIFFKSATRSRNAAEHWLQATSGTRLGKREEHWL